MADLTSLLAVNQKVQVKVAGGGREAFYSSRVEDLRPDRVAVATPMDATGLVRFPVGQPVWLVLAVEDAVLRLPGRVLGEVVGPVPITWIGDFGEPERVQRRRFFRVQDPPVVIHALSIKETGAALSGRVLNLSAGGMLLEVPERLDIGTLLCVDFTLRWAGRFCTDLEVVRTEVLQDMQGTKRRYGCRFMSLTWREEDAIICGLFCFLRDLRRRGLK